MRSFYRTSAQGVSIVEIDDANPNSKTLTDAGYTEGVYVDPGPDAQTLAKRAAIQALSVKATWTLADVADWLKAQA